MLFLTIILTFISTGPVLASGGNSSGGLANGGVTGESIYREDQETGAWTTIPVGISDSINGYRYELACFDNDAGVGDVTCIGGLSIRCEEGENGRIVQWFSGLNGTDPATWAKYGGGPTCIYDAEPIDVMDQIRSMILTEFQQRPIVSAVLTVQPSPHTLVGVPTNLFVVGTEQVFDLDLLGQAVRIIATPTEYEWNYGDGRSYGPAKAPGGPLPEDRWGEPTTTSHVYTATGDFPVSVTAYFSGSYSVNGGPVIPIDGRATVAGPAQTISVWRSESLSVADNCLINPAGVGC